MHYQPFTPDEDRQIITLRATEPPTPYEVIRRKLRRTKGSVIGRGGRLGLKRAPGLVMTRAAIRKRQLRAERKALAGD